MNTPTPLTTEFVFEARVDCDAPVAIGTSKTGKRRFIPITGGEFDGANIKGRVLPGGGDWQLLRPDGVNEIVARYTLQTHDGVNIAVVNRGIAVRPPTVTTSYLRTTPEFEAPSDSAYAWLNRSIFVGTVQVEREQPLRVLVRVFRVI